MSPAIVDWYGEGSTCEVRGRAEVARDAPSS